MDTSHMSLLIVLTCAPIDLSTAKTECPSTNAFFRAMTENDNGGRLVISYSNFSSVSSLDPRASRLADEYEEADMSLQQWLFV